MKKHLVVIALLCGSVGVVGVHAVGSGDFMVSQGPVAGSVDVVYGHTVELMNAGGYSVGTVTLTLKKTGVSLALDLKNLPPGEHAMHIHQIAKCEVPSFRTLGGLFSPEMAQGLENPDGPHTGDMGTSRSARTAQRRRP